MYTMMVTLAMSSGMAMYGSSLGGQRRVSAWSPQCRLENSSSEGGGGGGGYSMDVVTMSTNRNYKECKRPLDNC